MKKYWIIVKNQPVGPFSVSELKMRRDFTPDLPVWCSELPDWTTAGQVPELAELLNAGAPAEAEDCGANEVSTPEATPWVQTTQAPELSLQKPNTYIVWNIVLLLLANMLCGIIGIVFGMMVNRRWYAGNIEGAQSASNGAAWCIMIGIVLGLITWPFQLLIPMVI